MNDELLLKLESFEIDPPDVEFPFAARLARENSWTQEYSHRVIFEYKRFVWLAMRSGHPVTPSEEVDEAWHLHLCYTRSYWDEMCGQILGRPLHHGPTQGGAAEGEKFVDWYERTLSSYRQYFGEEPPADIWPSSEMRFRRPAVRKVDATANWIISKRTVRRGAVTAGVALGSLALAGCTSLIANLDGGGFFCFFAMLLLVIVAVVKATRGGRGGGSGCSSSSCGGGFSGDGGDDSGSSGCGSSGCGSGCGGCGGD